MAIDVWIQVHAEDLSLSRCAIRSPPPPPPPSDFHRAMRLPEKKRRNAGRTAARNGRTAVGSSIRTTCQPKISMPSQRASKLTADETRRLKQS